MGHHGACDPVRPLVSLDGDPLNHPLLVAEVSEQIR